MAEKRRVKGATTKRRIVAAGGRSDLTAVKKVVKKYTRKPKAGTKSVRKQTRNARRKK